MSLLEAVSVIRNMDRMNTDSTEYRDGAAVMFTDKRKLEDVVSKKADKTFESRTVGPIEVMQKLCDNSK